MTSVERARRFIETKGKAIALTIVPLASLAIAVSQPVKAANLTFGSGGCVVNATGVLQDPNGSCADTPIAGFQNGANSLKLSGTATVTAQSGGQFFPASSSSGGGFGQLIFKMTGSADGGIPTGPLPVSWDFTVETSRAIGSGSYTLYYRFNSGGFGTTEGGSLNFDDHCDDFSCAHVTSAGLDPKVYIDGPIFSYDIELDVQGTFDPGTFLRLSVPGNSVDVNPPTGTPEPASMALGATGLFGLAFARFRRRRKA